MATPEQEKHSCTREPSAPMRPRLTEDGSYSSSDGSHEGLLQTEGSKLGWDNELWLERGFDILAFCAAKTVLQFSFVEN